MKLGGSFKEDLVLIPRTYMVVHNHLQLGDLMSSSGTKHTQFIDYIQNKTSDP